MGWFFDSPEDIQESFERGEQAGANADVIDSVANEITSGLGAIFSPIQDNAELDAFRAGFDKGEDDR